MSDDHRTTPRGNDGGNLDFADLAKMVASIGRGSPTSIQRVFPLSMSGREDMSDQPLDGNYTSSLFLSTRNETEIMGEIQKQRRRLLDNFSNLALGPELRAELEELKNAEDAESETSEVEINAMYWVNPNREQTEAGSTGYEPIEEREDCGGECPLRSWESDEITLTTEIESLALSEHIQHDLSTLYFPLLPGQIRVLQIQAGQGTTPIKCQLRTLDLEAIKTQERHTGRQQASDDVNSSYEALSYCWGPPNLTHNITCDDVQMNVTRNLYSALHQLRDTTLPRLIWVDAICINQTDVFERSEQVRHMLQIYQMASRVVIWLGDVSGPDAETAITLIKSLEEPTFRNTMTEKKHDAICLDNLARAINCLNKFYQQPWFSRTWIRQELAAGKKIIVQCGDRELSWHMMKRAAVRMYRMNDKIIAMYSSDSMTGFQNPRNLAMLKRSWVYGQSVLGFDGVAGSWYYWHGGGLLDLLLAAGDFDATDPRDRVYAVLGLAREPIDGGNNEHALRPYTSTKYGDRPYQPFVIDYTQTVSKVFQQLAKYVINRDLNLDILCVLAMLRSQPQSDLPSWTPDWRISRDMSQWDYVSQKFEASGYTRAEYQDPEDEDQLNVKAYYVDDVEQLLDMKMQIWDLLYENGEAIIKSNGVLENRTRFPAGPIIRAFDEMEDARRCCLTNNRKVALIPKEAQVGDRIYILLGARIPFVLRPVVSATSVEATNDLDNRFTVVGPCCLPNYMQGEVFTRAGDTEAADLKLL